MEAESPELSKLVLDHTVSFYSVCKSHCHQPLLLAQLPGEMVQVATASGVADGWTRQSPNGVDISSTELTPGLPFVQPDSAQEPGF